jgi:hypothetical protein
METKQIVKHARYNQNRLNEILDQLESLNDDDNCLRDQNMLLDKVYYELKQLKHYNTQIGIDNF